MSVISKALEAVGVSYEIYRVYVQDSLPEARSSPANLTFKRVDGTALSLAADRQIRALESYDRPTEAFGFAAFIDGQIQSACWYWTGQTYAQRGFWPLQVSDAKLVQIVTANDFRGRGLAEALVVWSSAEMARAGFSRRYARMWHSNKSSIRAFEKAGWRSHALVATLSFPFIRSFLRLEKIVNGRLVVAIKKPPRE
jgi:hypothetical protein